MYFEDYAVRLDREINLSTGNNEQLTPDKAPSENIEDSPPRKKNKVYDNEIDCLLSLEELKKIKAKDRTDLQQKRYKHLMN